MFTFFEAAAALSAVSLIFIRQVFYGALLLIVCLLSLAALYILAFAEFVAVTQILVYAGGIVVVILFGVMLTAKIGEKPLVVQHGNVFGGALAAASLLALLLYGLAEHDFTPEASAVPRAKDAVQDTGLVMMRDFVLPFELAGMLLLMALIGAAVIAARTKDKRAS
ncbi:NADH-quinone oxidoreductase subunit J family protein [Dawidia soli]|uniref:NADH-quinone oxidoreductase subunit J n=1 Tax=Dawidia soli TaxID=2782352 RepID=A0AAP2DE54_9BACT|nr:NADH-quinone oxidoreductase subunit J [Dawidia soli]MBT1687732.1 NADH-quinone oxidoreductase subunit J [Dawidia soli]